MSTCMQCLHACNVYMHAMSTCMHAMFTCMQCLHACNVYMHAMSTCMPVADTYACMYNILTWFQLVWVTVDITCPRFIQQLISKNILVALEPLSHPLPEQGKVVLYLFLIVIQTLPVYVYIITLTQCDNVTCSNSHCLAHSICEIIGKEAVFGAFTFLGIPVIYIPYI